MKPITQDVILWNKTYDVLHWYAAIQRKICQFADASDTSHYTGERATNQSKAWQDIAQGKYGEIFANQVLIAKLGFPSIPVDFAIYRTERKSFAADLPYKSMGYRNFPNVHVKTCSLSTKRMVGEESWTFQWGNQTKAGGKDSLFTDPASEDVVAFVYLENYAAHRCTLIATAPICILHGADLFRPPRKADKVGLKKCIYYSDLLRYVNA